MLNLEVLIREQANAAAMMARESLDVIVESVVVGSLPIIEELQREQLDAGRKSNGRRILPEYAESTIKRKIRKGQPTDRVTLKDKGVFYAGIKATFSRTDMMIDITSVDVKTKFLVEGYGAKIFGLNKDFLGVYIDEYEPDFTSLIVRKFCNL